MGRLIVTIVLIVHVVILSAQITLEHAWEMKVEECLRDAGESAPEVGELIEWYRANPLDINACSVEDLTGSYLVSSDEARACIGYRDKYGSIRSIYELAAVEGFDLVSAMALSQILSLHSTHPAIRPEFRNNAFMSLPIPTDSSVHRPVFRGKVRVAMKGRWGNWKMAGILENDRNEDLFGGRNKAFDHMDLVFSRSGQGTLRSLVFGSYSVSFGNGNLLGPSFQVQPSAGTRRTTGMAEILTTGLSSETSRLRGPAIELSKGSNGMILFGSYTFRDGETDTVAGTPRLLHTQGYHNSDLSKRRKDFIEETSGGMLAWFRRGPISFALSGLYSELLTREDSAQHYSHHTLVSSALSWNTRRILLRSETSLGARQAWVQSLQLRARPAYGPGLYAAISYRSAEAAVYHSRYDRLILKDLLQFYMGTESVLSGDWQLSTGSSVCLKEDKQIPDRLVERYDLNAQLMNLKNGTTSRFSWSPDQNRVRILARIPVQFRPDISIRLLASANLAGMLRIAGIYGGFESRISFRDQRMQLQYLIVSLPSGTPPLYVFSGGIPGSAYTMGLFESGVLFNFWMKLRLRMDMWLGVRVWRPSDPLMDQPQGSLNIRMNFRTYPKRAFKIGQSP